MAKLLYTFQWIGCNSDGDDGTDQDCSGVYLTVVDGAGYDADVVDGPDCDDTDPRIHLFAPDFP